MLPPCRDDSSLQEQLDLGELPNGLPWEGAIAYLDRDGVLNRGSADYINHPDEVSLLPGAANAMAELRRSGFRICVITNQSPIGRGLWGHNRLRDVHERLRELLILEDNDAVIDLLLYSPYAPWEGSWARKPNPGMLEAGRQ
ncbi:MAG: HAD-IIIA family hydrolase, partial [Candidatus Thalassarchaeum sp.]|nr:HAD-IIIA family hydrolase [Candidatus Thalassarchaeum sp.]